MLRRGSELRLQVEREQKEAVCGHGWSWTDVCVHLAEVGFVRKDQQGMVQMREEIMRNCSQTKGPGLRLLS